MQAAQYTSAGFGQMRFPAEVRVDLLDAKKDDLRRAHDRSATSLWMSRHGSARTYQAIGDSSRAMMVHVLPPGNGPGQERPLFGVSGHATAWHSVFSISPCVQKEEPARAEERAYQERRSGNLSPRRKASCISFLAPWCAE